MRRMAMVRNDAVPILVTLTYPAEFPLDEREWKRHFDVFTKRLKRKRPEVGYFWKMEPQQRGAPHFHLLVWGASYRFLLWWVRLNWYEVVGSGDPKHLQAGTRVEWLRDANGARKYAAKYIAKLPDELPEGVDWNRVGRWWGVRYPDCIPWAECISVSLDYTESWKVLRVLRKYLGKVAGVWVRPGACTLSAFMDGERLCMALPMLL